MVVTAVPTSAASANAPAPRVRTAAIASPTTPPYRTTFSPATIAENSDGVTLCPSDGVRMIATNVAVMPKPIATAAP